MNDVMETINRTGIGISKILSGYDYLYILIKYTNIPEIMDEEYSEIRELIYNEIIKCYEEEEVDKTGTEEIFKIIYEKILKLKDEKLRESALSKFIPGLGPFLRYGMVNKELLKKLIDGILNNSNDPWILDIKNYLKINVFWLSPCVFRYLGHSAVINIRLSPEEILNSKEILDEDKREIIFYLLWDFLCTIKKYLFINNIEKAEEMLKQIMKRVSICKLAHERGLTFGLNNVIEVGYEIGYLFRIFKYVIKILKSIIKEKRKVEDYMLIFLFNFYHPRLCLYADKAMYEFIEWIAKEIYGFNINIDPKRPEKILFEDFYKELEKKYPDKQNEIKEFKFICFVLIDVVQLTNDGTDIFLEYIKDTNFYITGKNKENTLRLLHDILEYSPPLAKEVVKTLVKECENNDRKTKNLHKSLKKLSEMDPELASEWKALIKEQNPEILEVEVIN